MTRIGIFVEQEMETAREHLWVSHGISDSLTPESHLKSLQEQRALVSELRAECDLITQCRSGERACYKKNLKELDRLKVEELKYANCLAENGLLKVEVSTLRSATEATNPAVEALKHKAVENIALTVRITQLEKDLKDIEELKEQNLRLRKKVPDRDEMRRTIVALQKEAKEHEQQYEAFEHATKQQVEDLRGQLSDLGKQHSQIKIERDDSMHLLVQEQQKCRILDGQKELLASHADHFNITAKKFETENTRLKKELEITKAQSSLYHFNGPTQSGSEDISFIMIRQINSQFEKLKEENALLENDIDHEKNISIEREIQIELLRFDNEKIPVLQSENVALKKELEMIRLNITAFDDSIKLIQALQTDNDLFKRGLEEAKTSAQKIETTLFVENRAFLTETTILREQ